MDVIDKVAPIKERRIKKNCQEWFDGEIVDEIKNRDKLFKKLKKSKLIKISTMQQDVDYKNDF